MEIVTQQLGDALEVKVKGRLDNYWTEHLRGNLEEVIRGGAHGIRLNLSEISFLSSAGVGLLMKFHTQLKGIGGSFIVTSPSERVKQVLDLCRLSTILLAHAASAAQPAPQKIAEPRRFASSVGSFEVIECAPGKPLICERIGDPVLLKGCRFGAADCRMVTYPAEAFGFGLGAFGHGFEDAQTRFGEFLAVGGSAAYLIGTFTIGFILSLLALGVFISFRIFAFPDITADGSVTLGAAVAATLMSHGTSPLLASLAAFGAGMIAGACTGTLYTRFKINRCFREFW